MAIEKDMRALYVLVGLLVLNHSAFTGGRVAVSLYSLSLGAEPLLVGTLMALYAILPMFASVRVGRWVDRVGARNPMRLGAALVAAGTAVPFVIPGLAPLFASSVCVGAGTMLFHVAANIAVGTIGKPEDRAIHFSLLALGFSTSGFAGPLIAGIGIDHIGYRMTFAVLALLPAIAILLLGRAPTRAPRSSTQAEGHDKSHIFDLFRDRTLRRVFIASGLLSMGWDLYTFVIPIYGRSINLSASTIGAILGAFAAATFAVRLLMPLFARRLSAWGTLAFALTSAGSVFILFPLVENVPILFALSFLLGIGLGCAQPMVMAVLYSAAPAGRQGEAVGVRTSLINLSQSIFPLIFGALGSAVGIAPVFWTLASAMIAGGLSTWRGRARD